MIPVPSAKIRQKEKKRYLQREIEGKFSLRQWDWVYFEEMGEFWSVETQKKVNT